MTGRVLAGRYQLHDVIGSGGMAIVYRATDLQTGAEVAVKVLREELTGDAEFQRRFAREARAAAAMSHRNIIGLYDVGEDGGTRFLVMEYVRGKSLKDMILEKGRLRVPQAIDYAVQICRALEHAHANHIIHRDIKPQNIMVDEYDHVKVGDFGIARATNTQTQTIIEGGGVLGSVHYVSPEQARGLQADEASDLYSLGVVLYEMVTGKVPFDADTPVTVALKHIQEPVVRPRRIQPDCPMALEEVILKALSKERGMRYTRAHDMEMDLERVLVEPRGGFVVQPAPQQGMPAAEPAARAVPRAAPYAPPQQPEYAYAGVPANRRRSGSGMVRFLAILFLVLGATAIGIVLYNQFSNPTEAPANVRVPSVVNYRVAAATKDITDLGLVAKPEEQPNDSVEAGTVFKQDPEAGSMLRKGDEVKLYVSQGKAKATVPDLATKTQEQAKSELEALKLQVGTEHLQYDEAGTPGQVFRQDPAAGETVPEGTAVELWIYDEAPSFAMPDVRLKTEDQAKVILGMKDRELNVTVLEEESTTVSPGLICRQDPEAGTMVRKHQEVIIYKSKAAAATPLPILPTIEPTTLPGGETPVGPQSYERQENIQFNVPFEDTEVEIYSIELETGVQKHLHTAAYSAGVHSITVTVSHDGPGTTRIVVHIPDAMDQIFDIPFD